MINIVTLWQLGRARRIPKGFSSKPSPWIGRISIQTITRTYQECFCSLFVFYITNGKLSLDYNKTPVRCVAHTIIILMNIQLHLFLLYLLLLYQPVQSSYLTKLYINFNMVHCCSTTRKFYTKPSVQFHSPKFRYPNCEFARQNNNPLRSS